MGLTRVDDASIDFRDLASYAASLEPDRRARVRDDWALAARFEHASVASFDRFALQLLALGAPPSLLEAAHRAAIDEIRHARLSFAVASAYAGQPLGPGALAIEAKAFEDMSLASVVASAVEEGCVGETLAAAEAQAARGRAGHAALRHVLDAVAEDELQHAELAYRFVGWALATFGAPARAAIDVGFAAGIGRAEAELARAPRTGIAWIGEHGLLCPAERARVREEALRTTIVPAARALLP